MIITGKHTTNEKNQTRRTILLMGGFVILIAALFSLSGTRYYLPADKSSQIIASADAEEIKDKFFVNNNYRVKGAGTQSDFVARSGSYSSRINKDAPFGFNFEMKKPKKGTHFKASVWEYRTGTERGMLVVSADKDEDMYKSISLPSKKGDDGWELLTLYFTIPEDDMNRIKVYTFAGSVQKAVYFDDFKVEQIREHLMDDASSSEAEFKLALPDKSFEKLKNKKDDAVREGILITAENDWTKATIIEDEQEELPVSVRLKGDYLDHVSNDKWSMRVKVKGQNTFRGMKTFSIQSPHTRSFIREWLYHKMLEEADVLTPRYQFVHINVDHLKNGVYAMEEHFEKYLVESKQRREGPILKLAEDGFWLGYKRQMDFYGDKMLGERMENAFWKSEIQPFKESKLQGNETLANQYEVAQNLLFAHKYQSSPVSEIFDIQKLADMYAIMDVMDAYHGRAWHNQRFYYNPVISKLEPIGYDGFGEKVVDSGFPFMGYYFDREKDFVDFTYGPFLDEEFFRLYIKALDNVSRADSLSHFLNRYTEAIKANEQKIHSEYENYRFEMAPILEKGRKIQNLIWPLNEISLQVRTEKVEGNSQHLEVFNKHCLPLDVIGYGIDNENLIGKISNPVFVPNQIKGKLPRPTQVVVPVNAKYVFFRLPGVDSLYTSVISKWSGAESSFPTKQMEETFDMSTIAFVNVVGKDVIIPSGSHQLSQDLLIGKDQQLIVAAGANVDLTNNANIISYGPITMQGTSESPIHFTSSDKTGQSITVLQSPALSKIEYAFFSQLNTLDKDGWKLTGAVNFYESPVHIYNSKISDNQCEDALNIVRSEFFIDHLTIQNTFSDGFDADFCTGEIRNSTFINTGNDGMDFSGSNIQIGGTKIIGAGDKGISVGEESNVHAWNANIKDSNIGVASKDKSGLTIHWLDMENCNIGYAAYQKKPEFGPANIRIMTEVVKGIKYPNQIEKGSSLTIGAGK